MIELFIDILIVISSIMSLFAICFVFLLRIIKAIKGSQSSKSRDIEDEKIEFLNSPQPGKNFISLIYGGVFSSLKTGNHGSDFPDKKQIENFKKYATQEICDKVNGLEVPHEKFII